MSITVHTKAVRPFIGKHELQYMQPAIAAAHNMLHQGNGPGSEFLGWLDPVLEIEEIGRIQDAAHEIQKSQALVVVGIGGSYLGAKAAVEALGHTFNNQMPGKTAIYFAGHTISSDYHADLLEMLEDRDFCVNVISKSGTTTEPAIAFRLLRDLLEKKYGKEGARKRVYATTDESKGALRQLAMQEGYQTFIIPDDVGGRFSVLTPVGLLPMAVAGIDIKAVLKGAANARQSYNNPDLKANPCYTYAALRNILYKKGKGIELLIGYHPRLHSFAEWWKQLFGESEGKDGKGIFPAAAMFSTDLHSLGQYIQDGRSMLFETVLNIRNSHRPVTVPKDVGNLDKLNYLAGKDMDFVNNMAMKGTLLAHNDGDVPNILLEVPFLTDEVLGELVYFMEKACAISGYMLGVNPFDQPGVEEYKQNMFALLGKPGFEERAQNITRKQGDADNNEEYPG